MHAGVAHLWTRPESSGAGPVTMERVPTNPGLMVALPGMQTSEGSQPRQRDGRARLDELVTRARAGDVDAWSRLYQDTFDDVLRHVCFLTGNASVAEDLVQDAYARAMSHIHTFDGRSSFLSWLRAIALNVVRMHWRRSHTSDRALDRLRELVDLSTGGATAPVDKIHQQDLRMRLLYELLATIPENLREAFVLRELHGISPEEAAAQLGISVGNLAVRASRARARLRQELERLGWTERSAT